MESLQCEGNALIKQLEALQRTVSSSSEDLRQQYLPLIQVLSSLRWTRWSHNAGLSHLLLLLVLWYFQGSLQEGEQVRHLLSVVEEKKTQLCLYVCEDSSHFSTDDFFSTIRTFRGLFLCAVTVSSQSERSTVTSQSDVGSATQANNGKQPLRIFSTVYCNSGEPMSQAAGEEETTRSERLRPHR